MLAEPGPVRDVVLVLLWDPGARVGGRSHRRKPGSNRRGCAP